MIAFVFLYRSRLCWALAVLAFVLVDGRPPNCEQKERSLAGLDQAEDSLKKARDLYPECEDETDLKNSSECSRKDKSLAFIDVALDLVSNAKKNYPVCKPEIVKERERPMDCQDLLSSGYTESGVYTVWPRSRAIRGKAVLVRCDMDTEGGGWTVIQRRGNFSQKEDFERNWEDYKNGFGNLSMNFWLGNDNIFSLSNQDAYSLRIDMETSAGKRAHDQYGVFFIDDEASKYKLHVTNHSDGTAGNSMGYHNGNMFSTKDRDNDRSSDLHCALVKKSGFWHKDCARCNPNGLYKPGNDVQNSMHYFTFDGYVGLRSIEMKLKRL